jgi:hypothetical protein
MKIKIEAAALALVAMAAVALPAAAATLNLVDLKDPRVVVQDDGKGEKEQRKIFTTEIKRDHGVDKGQGRGRDAFLRNGESSDGESIDIKWDKSGTSYDWSVWYDGDVAVLEVAGQGRKLDVKEDGRWNAVQFFLRADNIKLFNWSALTVVADKVNGEKLDQAIKIGAKNEQVNAVFALDKFDRIESLSGSFLFDFELAKGGNGSPNSQLSFNLKAWEVQPTAVPLPAGLPLLAGGFGLLAVLARRRCRSA